MLLSIALAVASLTTSFDVAGVHVILRQNNANNVVAANLYLLGGSQQVTAANAGIEPVLLDVSDRGTQRYPKNSLRRAMSRLGSEIVVAPSADWTMFGIRSSTEVFDSTWAIFAERVMHPTLARSEVNVVKAQYLSGIRQRRDDPNALAGYLADSMTVIGHPYAVSVSGNEKSITSLDSASLRDYHRSQFVTSRMLLVVVGNVDRPHIERLVSQSIGQLPRGQYKWVPPPRIPELQTAVVIERRQLPTNYVLGYYSGPLAKGRDYQALRVATSVLTGRMFAEIRTRQSLTYDVHAPFVDRAATAGGLFVSTVSPDTTLKLMRAAIVELQLGTIDPIGLKQLEEQFITEYFLDNETNAAQADFLARSQLYEGDYRRAERFMDEIKSVTPEDIQRVAKKYMKGFRFAYVGDPSKLNLQTISSF
jgi:zinc protease